MPRPTKCRRVCALPRNRSFFCSSGPEEKQTLCMTVEEYETIRLIDGEGMTQEECAARMDVARTTAQRIYLSARQKLAGFLTEGGKLEISGGSYAVCARPDCGGHDCGGRGCPGRREHPCCGKGHAHRGETEENEKTDR